LNASLSPEPRSAAAETASDETFLRLVTSIGAAAVAGPHNSLREHEAHRYEAFVAALACDGLAFMRVWRTALHAAYALAVECYPDANLANAVFTSSVSGGSALEPLMVAFEDACSRAGVMLPAAHRVLLFDLAGEVTDRFVELNRDHTRLSGAESAVMRDGEWIAPPVLFTRTEANRDWPLPTHSTYNNDQGGGPWTAPRSAASSIGGCGREPPHGPGLSRTAVGTLHHQPAQEPLPQPQLAAPPLSSEETGGPTAHGQRKSHGRVVFARHDEVTIQMLKSRPELNGQRATVLGWDATSERVMIKVVVSGDSMKLKPECLLPHIEEGD